MDLALKARAGRPLVQTLLFPLAARFVAGDSVADALSVVRRLNDDGLRATIDILGEDVKDAVNADRTQSAYLALIDTMRRKTLDANLSLKLSALGLTTGDGATIDRLNAVLDHAAVLSDPFVRVDMEGSRLLPRTLETIMAAYLDHKNTGPVLQAYLHRTQADVHSMNNVGMRVRLCKGAYKEPRAIAYGDMSEIRVNYLACATALLKDGTYPAFATHDPTLITAVRELADEFAVEKRAFEFQLLYGVRPELQHSLARDGYNVRVYVPYGSHWAQYFRRRVFERRENLVFAIRSAFAR